MADPRGISAVTPDNAGNEGVPQGLLLSLTYSKDHNRPFDRLWVGATGNVAIVGFDGTVATIVGVPTGTIVPIGGRRVNSTNTTATSIVAIRDT